MARKSLAALSVAVIHKDARLPVPTGFTPRQKQIYLELVSSKPSDWFQTDAIPLLTAYCKAISYHEILSVQIEEAQENKIDIKDLRSLYEVHGKQAGLIQSCATKLRLTAQSRWQPSTASVKSEKATGPRPWDFVG